MSEVSYTEKTLVYAFIFPYIATAIIFWFMLIPYLTVHERITLLYRPPINSIKSLWTFYPNLAPGVINNRLINTGGNSAPAYLIGVALGKAFKKGCIVLPGLLGWLVGTCLPAHIMCSINTCVIISTMANVGGVDRFSLLAFSATGLAAAYPMTLFIITVGRLVSHMEDISEYTIWKENVTFSSAFYVIHLAVASLFAFART